MSLARVKIKKFSSTTLCSFSSAVRLWPAHIKYCRMSVTCDCHLDHLKTKCVHVRVGEVYCRSIIMQRRETRHSLLVHSTLRPTETPRLENGEIHIFTWNIGEHFTVTSLSELFKKRNSVFLILIGFYALGIHLKLLIRYFCLILRN